ncbi:MAG: hypothetical protein M3541_08495 [Acidobacteriota bacterium]|nr:hypothetical protein [Acidobacteriota bacterium]MDQ3418805.1 hypothetical protein [Acidobacteriota bacterium]
MKLARTGIIAAAILSVASVAFAQKTDFSGSWAPEAPAAAPAGGGGGGRGGMMGGPMVVKQTADTLTVETTRGEMKTVATYKLDGAESVNKMSMGRGENATQIETKSTAKWDGAKLVISTTREGQNGPMTSAQTWSLEGGMLTIERPGRDGATRKTVYKKTTS